MTVRTRFAPSPTGYLHIGGARTALFSWMFAKRHGGQFILRIEDTDQKRSVDGAIEAIIESMRWLGIDWDEGPDIGGPYGPYIQTERADLYQKWANWLVENGHAYKCFATREELKEMRDRGVPFGYDRSYRDLAPEKVAELEASGKPFVIRFKMPLTGETVIHDLIRGDIVFQNSQINDFVLMKSTGLPTYHLAHIVDDHFMKITHNTRADEWINTAPLHVNIWKAFGWEMPIFAHMPVILNPNGKGKLSKRTQSFQDGEYQVLVKVSEYEEAGFLPQAVNNFLANVGYSTGDDREIYEIAEAVEEFTFDRINPSPTRLPYPKLTWINGQYIQEMDSIELAKAVKPYLEAAGFEVNVEALLIVMPAMKVRLKRFPEAVEFLRFLFEESEMAETGVSLSHNKLPHDAAGQAFKAARDFVANTAEYDLETISNSMAEIGAAHTLNEKAGPFLGKMRQAITGQKISPPLYESMLALGRERVLNRLDEVVALFDIE